MGRRLTRKAGRALVKGVAKSLPVATMVLDWHFLQGMTSVSRR